jgi:hypothetical protein
MPRNAQPIRYSVWPALGLLLLAAACGTVEDSDNTHPSSETNYSVSGEFLEFYNAHGGEHVLGKPITEGRVEDGLMIQYFENTRLEHHPDALPGWRVQLARLLVLRDREPDPPIPRPPDDDRLTAYYPATGHTVRSPFLSLYVGYGGPSVFGYPLTEIIVEHDRQVQYFERAVFYWDGEAPPGERVKLAPLGHMALHPEASWWGDMPRTFPSGLWVAGAFRDFFEAYGDVAVFGQPLTNAYRDPEGHTVQVFENVCLEMYGPAERPLVRLASLGARLAPPGQPTAAPDPTARCFAETGFCLALDFLDFFNAHGGQAVFGLPRSPVLIGEDDTLVQYLDGARFEWDPQTERIHLSPLGQWLLAGDIPNAQ